MGKVHKKMLKYIIIYFLLISQSFGDEPDKDLHNKCLYPTVLLAPKEQNMAGTGVIVRSDKISDTEYHNVVLTNAHVFNYIFANYKVYHGSYKDWSKFEGYVEYRCHKYYVDKSKDVAVAFFKSETPVPVAEMDFDSKLYIGSKVLRVGCGMKEQFRIDEGKITSVNLNLNEHFCDVYRTSVPCVTGDSGGPIYHNNKVVGIIFSIRSALGTRTMLPIYHMSYAIPLKYFKESSEKHDNKIDFVFDFKKEIPKEPFFAMEVEKMVEDHLFPEEKKKD